MRVKTSLREPTDQAEDPAPRERIVLATIGCLERHGVNGTTVRRIAEAAGVNIAAINYYFGTKEVLLEAALAHTLREAFPQNLTELVESISNKNGDIEAGTRAFFEHYLVHAFEYPRISVAHLKDALFSQDYSGPAVAAMRDFVDDFYAVVSPAMGQPTDRDRQLAVLHVWATIFTLAMLPDLFAVPRDSLTGPEMVTRFCTTLFGIGR